MPLIDGVERDSVVVIVNGVRFDAVCERDYTTEWAAYLAKRAIDRAIQDAKLRDKGGPPPVERRE